MFAAFSKSNSSRFGPSIETIKRLFEILLLILFRGHFFDNLLHTWELSLVFHVISLEVSLNLWLTVPFNGYRNRFHGGVNELKPYQLREKAMKKL